MFKERGGWRPGDGAAAACLSWSKIEDVFFSSLIRDSRLQVEDRGAVFSHPKLGHDALPRHPPQECNIAAETLTDERKRAAYDAALLRSRSRDGLKACQNADRHTKGWVTGGEIRDIPLLRPIFIESGVVVPDHAVCLGSPYANGLPHVSQRSTEVLRLPERPVFKCTINNLK